MPTHPCAPRASMPRPISPWGAARAERSTEQATFRFLNEMLSRCGSSLAGRHEGAQSRSFWVDSRPQGY